MPCPDARILAALILALAFLPIHACEDPTGPERPIGGAFLLVTFNGDSLPATIADLPPRSIQPAGQCFQEVRNGVLFLEPDFQIFELHYDVRHSCTGAVLSSIRYNGVYDQNDMSLRLTDPSIEADRSDIVFSARVEDEGEVIGVDVDDDVLAFRVSVSP